MLNINPSDTLQATPPLAPLDLVGVCISVGVVVIEGVGVVGATVDPQATAAKVKRTTTIFVIM